MIRLPALVLYLLLASSAAAITLPSGFQDETIASGLYYPMAVRFAPDGRMFVAEKSGLVKVYDSVSDPSPTVFADLRTNVHSYWDRGLLGLALHPEFPAKPWVYVLYTYNALPGGSAPQWPTSDGVNDTCPSPPGPMGDGCVVTGRLSRLEIDGANQQVGDEHVLIENNWCQQFPSHSIGDLAFGADGALYVSGGDGASFGNVDWGQYGGNLPDATSPVTPRNPCADPPGGVGGAMSPPSAEGGALRAQDLATPGDPVAFNGAILRLDPETGAALPDNPRWGGAVLDDDPVVAYGFRNPFRIAIRPGTNELWIGDVGWNDSEEINRVADPTALQLGNFGWPCFEGNVRQGSYDSANLAICESLYAAGTDTKPFYTYQHGSQPGDAACQGGSSSIAGLTFYAGGTYPGAYSDALFFTDYSRRCIWTMTPGPDGLPDPSTVQTFASGMSGPVALERGPGGDVVYVDFDGGKIRRIRYTGTNHPPVADARADVTTGASPLVVHFDGTASSDQDASDTLSFAWDLDGDGAFDDASDASPIWTYATSGSYAVRLRVTDSQGASDVDALTVSVDNTPPTAVITAPAPSFTWSVDDPIVFAGSASDPEQGTLPASALRWQIVMLHCPAFDCHAHTIQDVTGVTGGTFVAPDHEYPSMLEIRLTATDAGGLAHTTSVQVAPKTATLTFRSVPAGLTLAVGATVQATPFTRDVIVGSHNSIGAPSPQTISSATYTFASWSDGGAASHDVIAAMGGATYTAAFAGGTCGNGLLDAGETCDDGNLSDGDCCSASCALVPAGTACRAAAGVCDVPETCDGISNACPADTFAPPTQSCRGATGVCDLAETCTGASASCPGDAKGTGTCRPAADACDPAETCDGTSDACPADLHSGDGDADGLCDLIDPCTGGSEVERGRLALSRLDDTPGNDRLRLSGQVVLPISPSPVIDPFTRGLRLLLTDAAGSDFVDATLPAGYDAGSRIGWTTRGSTSWRYDGYTMGPAGITRVTLRLSPQSGLVKFKVTGKNATYPLDRTHLPISAALVFDPPRALTGRCGEARFAPSACVAAGTSVQCR